MASHEHRLHTKDKRETLALILILDLREDGAEDFMKTRK
jgi:hypothetical protein